MRHIIMALGCIGLCLVAASTVYATDWTTVFQNGADRLTALQNNDGGWDYPLDDGNPDSGTANNCTGPTGMGLVQAYLKTGDSDHLAALQNLSANLQTQRTYTTTPYYFSCWDGLLAARLDSILGGTANVDYVKAHFYDELAAGTYEWGGAYYDTGGFVDGLLARRPGWAAWDVGVGLASAGSVGASTSEWVQGTKDALNELEGDTGLGSYWVLDLASGVFGLACAGVTDFVGTSGGPFDGVGGVSGLAAILADAQMTSGGFTWDKNTMIPGDDESAQATAYAILGLNEFDSSTYASQIQSARDYLVSVQLATGGWEDFVGDGEYNEMTGEALWAIPEPATLALMGLGSAFALIRRRRK